MRMRFWPSRGRKTTRHLHTLRVVHFWDTSLSDRAIISCTLTGEDPGNLAHDVWRPAACLLAGWIYPGYFRPFAGIVLYETATGEFAAFPSALPGSSYGLLAGCLTPDIRCEG